MTNALSNRFAALLAALFLFAAAPAAAQDAPEFAEEDLRMYAQAVHEINLLKQGINDTLLVIIEEEGMEPKRYNELHGSRKMPDFEESTPAEELTTYKRIDERMAPIQGSLNAGAKEAIKGTGLSLKSYVAIKKVYKQDRALRAQIDERVNALTAEVEEMEDGEASVN
ncbi:MAG: DUF4168 domain-containing protein [Catalinimonas sp.]